MTWIERKKWFDTSRGNGRGKQTVEMSFSVTEVADMLSISRQTVFKYLSFDEPEAAVIPPNAWYRLPSGHIRIMEWIVLKLQETT